MKEPTESRLFPRTLDIFGGEKSRSQESRWLVRLATGVMRKAVTRTSLTTRSTALVGPIMLSRLRSNRKRNVSLGKTAYSLVVGVCYYGRLGLS